MDKEQVVNLDMIYYINQSYVRGALGMFDALDTDGDKLITEEELKKVFPSEDFDVTNIIAKTDRLTTDKISFKEFLKLLTHDMMDAKVSTVSQSDEAVDPVSLPIMVKGTFLMCVKAIRIFFQAHDTNGDEQISVDEIKAFKSALGDKITDEEAKEIVKSVDLNDDGQVNFKEFVFAVMDDLNQVSEALSW